MSSRDIFGLVLLAGTTVMDRTTACSSEPRDLRLIPFPKEVELTEGEFPLNRSLSLEVGGADGSIMERILRSELALVHLPLPSLRASSAQGHFVWLGEGTRAAGTPLRVPGKDPEEEYVLEVDTNHVGIRASGQDGLFHGVQTLRQLIRANRQGESLPCLEIRDWPSIRWRAFQDDITRGPSSTLEELCREIELGSFFKFNIFTYYMQSQFAFEKHPVIGPQDGSLEPEELAALVKRAGSLRVNVIGNQQSFAHLEDILKHPQYAHLREDGRTLSPVREETYQLLDDLYSEVAPLVPFPFFNVCCDETWNLGSGPSKDLAREIGAGGVYLRHIRRVHELITGKYRKRMMMWADIILQHPDRIAEVPEDIILLVWGYDRRDSFEDQIVPVARSGHEFFVCPGVKCWGEVLPNFETAAINIRNFIRDGARHGAIGALITSWDDDGENLNAPNWHGFAWGAECAWNASATPYAEFQRRVGGVLFGESTDRFRRAIEILSSKQAKGYNGLTNREFWNDEDGPMRVADARHEIARHREWVDDVRRGIRLLEECRGEAVAEHGVLDAFLFGGRRFELYRGRRLDRLEAALRYRDAARRAPQEAVPLLREIEDRARSSRLAYATLRGRWKYLWLRENRPYSLDRTLARYDRAVARYDGLLRRLAEARIGFERGRPLPSPRDMGLEVVEISKKALVHPRIAATPLAPGAEWAAPGAGARFGLTVRVDSAVVGNAPLETTVALPPEISGGHVRAFQDVGSGRIEEILAQLDSTHREETRYLTLVLRGPLAAGGRTPIWVYCGLENPSEHPERVATTDGADGTKWIENNRVRLLLSPKGTHIYRWEVKDLGGLDLTAEGAAGWAGFSDLGGARREARGELRCLAYGPALVRYRSVDATGFEKTISVFGGASWMEVTLGEAVSYYWDFDAPEHFSADGTSPGRYLFSNGLSGSVRSLEDGRDSQVRAEGVRWAVKHREDGLLVGLATPEAPCTFRVGPGGNWGGVGIERSPPALHFVTVGGVISEEPGEHMKALVESLTLGGSASVVIHGLEERKLR